jgi:hypothetical protein
MDRPNPRNLTREQLASFIPRVDVQRAVESFFKYLAESLPDAVDSNSTGIDDAQSAAISAANVAAISQAIASAALEIANQANEAPPVVQAPPQETSDVEHMIAALQSQMHALALRVSALEERP